MICIKAEIPIELSVVLNIDDELKAIYQIQQRYSLFLYF